MVCSVGMVFGLWFLTVMTEIEFISLMIAVGGTAYAVGLRIFHISHIPTIDLFHLISAFSDAQKHELSKHSAYGSTDLLHPDASTINHVRLLLSQLLLHL